MIGTTRPLPAVEAVEVGEKLGALLGSIRAYVVAVSDSVMRKKPQTQALADTLLRPLAEWRSKASKAKPGADEAPAAPDASGTDGG